MVIVKLSRSSDVGTALLSHNKKPLPPAGGCGSLARYVLRVPIGNDGCAE